MVSICQSVENYISYWLYSRDSYDSHIVFAKSESHFSDNFCGKKDCQTRLVVSPARNVITRKSESRFKSKLLRKYCEIGPLIINPTLFAIYSSLFCSYVEHNSVGLQQLQVKC
jgi:hypothetical protein